MNKKSLIVNALLLYKEKDGYSFLELTRASGHNHGDLPGGKVEPGESPLVAIIREVAEETGLVLDQIEYFKTYHFSLNGKEYEQQLFYSVVTTQEVILDPQEHSGFRWLKLDQIGESNLLTIVKKNIAEDHSALLQLLEHNEWK